EENRTANARPIPEPAPVITTFFPANEVIALAPQFRDPIQKVIPAESTYLSAISKKTLDAVFSQG
ncbi:MAG: hypothetical protein NTZ90_06010, partial [Proteobacteria bacterium]|nr:hypothetical protein [Pseudomonadota bacterium]